LSDQCRKADISDYVVASLLYLGDKTLQNVLNAEEEKPYDQRNNKWIVLGQLCRIGINYLMYETNKDLCNPIV
jgi:hypothetical protein